MGENLAGHVVGLRRKLQKITMVYVDKQTVLNTDLMVELEAMKAEIDSLDAFVLRRHDERCLSVLRKKMTQYFSVEETKTLMHDMGISVFEYTGDTMTGMHTEFIGFCQRRDLLPLLMETLRQHRSRVKWPEC